MTRMTIFERNKHFLVALNWS